MVTGLLIKQLIVFFMYMAAGFIIVKAGILKEEESAVISKIVIYVLLPSAIIQGFQVEYTHEIMKGFLFAIVTSAGIIAFQFAITYGLARPAKFNEIDKGSIIYPNSSNLIFPLVLGILGQNYIIYVSAYSTLQGILVWTHGYAMMSGQRKFELKKILNFNIIVVLVGILLFIFQIQLPELAQTTLSGLSAALGPMSMFGIGMVISGVKWGQILSNKKVLLIVFIKMIVVPAASLVVLKYSGVASRIADRETILLIVLFAVMAPTGVIVTQMSQLYGHDERYAGAINVITTLLCMVTMPLFTYWYSM